MRQDGALPRARRDGLLEETLGEELLLYDQNSHTAHCLRPVAACVWRHCDGERDMSELAELAGASGDLVAAALRELQEKDLLAEPQIMQSAVPGVSRREAIIRVARYGATAAAGSMVVSATAATPAMASSGEEAGPCVKASGYSCCVCKDGCVYGPESETQADCEIYCGAGNYENYKKGMTCKK
jgi:hypothetical protein